MLGDLIPVMAGVAIAGRYLGQKIVTMTWIGDGGSSTGVFHEGLNFAATQKAPFCSFWKTTSGRTRLR